MYKSALVRSGSAASRCRRHVDRRSSVIVVGCRSSVVGCRQSSVVRRRGQLSVVMVIVSHRSASSVVGHRWSSSSVVDCRSSIVGRQSSVVKHRSSIIGRQSSVVVGRRSPLLVKQTRHPALLLAECWSWVRRDSLLTATVCIWKGVGSAGFIANGVASDGEGSHGLGLDRVIPMESVWKASALTAVVQMALVLTVLAQLEMEWARRDSLLLATVCIWKGVGSAGFIANGVASDGEGSHGLWLRQSDSNGVSLEGIGSDGSSSDGRKSLGRQCWFGRWWRTMLVRMILVLMIKAVAS